MPKSNQPIDEVIADLLGRGNKQPAVQSTHQDSDTILRQIRQRQQELLLANSSTTAPKLHDLQEVVLATDDDKINDLADLPQVNSRPLQEVYKDKKTERCKDTSRQSEQEVMVLRSSNEDLPLAGTSPTPAAAAPLISSEEQQLPKGEGGSVVPAAARTSSCRYAGIGAQHAQTKSGVKLALTLQTPEDQRYFEGVKTTAELKPFSRRSQIKTRPGDSAAFEQALQSTITQVLNDPDYDEVRDRMVLGRVHTTGHRSPWLNDTFVWGVLDREGRMQQAVLWSENEEYDLMFDQELSDQQQQYYHCSAIYGQLVRKPQTRQTLSQVPRQKI